MPARSLTSSPEGGVEQRRPGDERTRQDRDGKGRAHRLPPDLALAEHDEQTTAISTLITAIGHALGDLQNVADRTHDREQERHQQDADGAAAGEPGDQKAHEPYPGDNSATSRPWIAETSAMPASPAKPPATAIEPMI